MHQFICKTVEGKIVPLQSSKIPLLNKLLNSYEELDKKYKLTIEVIEKNINNNQISLYNAFIIKASNHFGNTYKEMDTILEQFAPSEYVGKSRFPKPLNNWTTKELDTFINQASALLAEQGFIFE